jgi:hypothetical protein
MVCSNYCCNVDTWFTLSTIMSFSPYTCNCGHPWANYIPTFDPNLIKHVLELSIVVNHASDFFKEIEDLKWINLSLLKNGLTFN